MMETGFETVTLTDADVLRLFAASRARAASVCTPFAAGVVSQVRVYGAAVISAPRAAPSRRNCTPVTPTLSAAVAATATAAPATVAPFAGAVIETVGGVVSVTTLLTVTVTARAAVVLPALSRATAVSAWVPLAAVVEFHAMEYGLTVSSAPRLTPSSLNCTPATAVSSAAVAEIVTLGPDTVERSAGVDIETVGAVVSGDMLIGRISAMNRL